MKYITFFIGWPLSLLAIFFILKFTSSTLHEVLQLFHNVHPLPLLLSIVCFITYFFMRSYIWNLLLAEKGHHVSFKDIAYLWGVSELRRYIPGNIWSFLSRAVLFKKRAIAQDVIITGMFAEAQIFLLGGFISLLIATPVVVNHFFPDIRPLLFFYPVAFIVLLLIVFAYVYSIYFVNHIPKKDHVFFRFILPNRPPQTNMQLLLLSCICFLLFGIGTYFSLASVVYINLYFFSAYISLIIISFFLGYLSFITPMGLGVREGILTIGFAKTIPLATASALALFARFIFMLSELLFIALAYIWCRTRGSLFLKIERFLTTYRYAVCVTFFVLLFIGYFSTASILRHNYFYTGRFDLGNMDQTVWNTVHGRVFELTNPDSTEIISRLAFHADFILILLSPLYFLWQDPRMLLLIQAIIVGCGAFFVYKLASRVHKKPVVGVIFAFLYLLYPGLQYATLYDFHAVTLAATFLIGAFYFLYRDRYLLFICFGLLAALTKENIWATFGLLGLFLSVSTWLNAYFYKKTLPIKRVLFGVLVCIAAFGIGYYLIAYAIPQARGGEHFALAFYTDFGSTPAEAIRTVLTNPQKTFSVLLAPDRLRYIMDLLTPVGFLPIFAPWLLIFAIPDLFINLLSSNPNFRQLYYQYTPAITPFIFVAAIFGLQLLKKKIPLSYGFYMMLLLSVGLYGAWRYGPLPFAKSPNLDMFTKQRPDAAVIDRYLSQIPKHYRIAATNNLGAHLSHRQYIFTIPVGIDKADIIAFLIGDPFAQPSPQVQKEMIISLKKNKKYRVLYEKDGFIVFQKRQ